MSRTPVMPTVAGQGAAGPKRPPAMSDVAARAGVSHQTVSRVLNSHPSVRQETRDRVQEAIVALGYRRNSAARTLVTQRSETLGLITTRSVHHGPASTLIGLEAAARDVGYYASIASIDQFDACTLSATVNHFLDQAVDGIVIVVPQIGVADALRTSRFPVPLVAVTSGNLVAGVGSPGADPGTGQTIAAVGVDQRGGAQLAVDHLAANGHSAIAHLAGPQDWFDAQERLSGWRAACAAAGVEAVEPELGDWTAESGYRAGIRMAAGALPTAIFAANDQLALGLLRAFGERGVRVPEDVSVVGFDDEVGSAYYLPPLTTIRQDFAALGRAAIDAMVRSINGEHVASSLLPTELVVRASTGPAARTR